ncbi:hypothetical protein ACFY0R_10205 [Streptomyces sp. NPDC001633]|uniref:hypothetical protein n=1 Tax=Streptomyces sp. NPDC001633 TaxID=3364595 RepID=UPI0036CCE228
MQFLDLAAQTRLLSQTALTLESLRTEMDQVGASEIAKPVRELCPITRRAHELAAQCTQQVADLAASQYGAMKDGVKNLALLTEASAQVSLSAGLCALAIHSRTEVLLYEDADATPAASRSVLADAISRMDASAGVYRGLAQRLSRRLASAAARQEDQRLIARAQADRGITDTADGRRTPTQHRARTDATTMPTTAPVTPAFAAKREGRR